MGKKIDPAEEVVATEEAVPSPVAIIDEEVLRGRIYEIRGQKVMLDFELAEIYGYSTTAFNQQVQRNIGKFDEDFMFQLTEDEWEILMSQIVTSSWGGRRKLPYAFTEQGVYMLMTVLRGELATRQSKALIRLFKRMKDAVIENQGLIGRREFLLLSMQVSRDRREIDGLRGRLWDVEDEMSRIVEQLGDLVAKSDMAPVAIDFGDPAIRRDYLIMNGDPIMGALTYGDIYSWAAESIIVVDNYIGLKTLVLLKSARPGVRITIASDNLGRRLHRVEYEDFRRQYPSVSIDFRRTCGMVHDRYIALDYGTGSERVFHCGASSKDAGEKATTIMEAERPSIYRPLLDELLANPSLELA